MTTETDGPKVGALFAGYGGLEQAMRLLDQHGATHPDCDHPARHLLATTPTLRVIPGGAA